jgi:acyl carrier protein
MTFPSLDEVVKSLREIADDDTIGPDTVIAELGIDSLSMIEWVYEIEGEAGFVIDESLYSSGSLTSATVADFYERVKNSSP